MIDIEIRDFQSIDSLDLKIDGFTVIVGRNNIGKSAIIRALKCAFTGAEGTAPVRHDPKVCSRHIKGNKKCSCFYSVKLDFNDGLVVKWEKGDTISRYTIWENGKKEVYDRVGKHPELPEALVKRFSPVKVGDSSNLLQIASQYDTVFLFNKSGTVVADALGDLEKLDQVTKATVRVVRDRKAAKTKRKMRESDTAALEKALEVYKGLPEDLYSVKQAETTLDDLVVKEAKIDTGRRLMDDRNTVVRAIRSLKTSLEPKLEPIDLVQAEFERWSQANSFCQQRDVLSGEVSYLEQSEALDVPSLPSLQLALESFSRVGAWLSRLVVLKQGWNTLRVLEAAKLEDPDALKGMVGRLAIATDFCTRVDPLRGTKLKKKRLAAIDLEVPDLEIPLEKVLHIDGFLQQKKELEVSLQELKTSLKKAEEVEQGILDEFAELGICPTCTQAITPTHVVC